MLNNRYQRHAELKGLGPLASRESRKLDYVCAFAVSLFISFQFLRSNIIIPEFLMQEAERMFTMAFPRIPSARKRLLWTALLIFASLALLRRSVRMSVSVCSSVETVSMAKDANDNTGNLSGSHYTLTRNDLPLCPVLPKDLGLVGTIFVNLIAPTWKALEALHPELQPGGRWKPKHCRARSRVAIVVPYLDRDRNLRIFLQHMHPFLQKQQLEYGIFVTEPVWERPDRTLQFNRGLMRNIGFKEATKNAEYDCVVFQDLDLLPEIDNNSYACSDLPKHICIAIDYQMYKPFRNKFGGVVSFREDHFQAANGYSNLYFGWGGEDDDLWERCFLSGVGMYHTTKRLGRYKGAPHRKDQRAAVNRKLWHHASKRWKEDGLNTLKYTLLERRSRPTYTWNFVDYDERTYKQARDRVLKDMKQRPQSMRKNVTLVDKVV